jgi:ABC-type branched-subunit amino acid transport system ATPase component
MGHILRIKNLTKHFNGDKILNGISLAVERGSITALIGPNGAGKSTVFSIVAGLIKGDAGSVFLDDEEISGESPRTIANLGVAYLLQERQIFPELTALENVMLGFDSQAGESLVSLFSRWRLANRIDAVCRRRALMSLETYGLRERADQMAREFSFGEQKRVAFARLQAMNSKLLLLDEPTAGLDHSSTAEVITAIQALKEAGISILITEHDIDLVSTVADHVYVLHRGGILTAGSSNELRRHPEVIAAYLGQ